MANINDIFNKDKLEQALTIPVEVEDPKIQRLNLVQDQLQSFFKVKKRNVTPSVKEFSDLIDKYFEEIYTENLSKYTLHTFLGLTESNVTNFILVDDQLKEIYDFAIEKLKAKAEIQLQIAGRSTDAFTMQNIAGWRKKDIEEKEESSGLADFHDALDEHNKNDE